jgi:hypothetical protein
MRTLMATIGTLALSLPALAGETPVVRFEGSGLRIAERSVSGPVLELCSAGESALLASAKVVEPLSGLVSIEIAAGRLLGVEPGVRVERTEKGFRAFSPAGQPVRIAAGGKELASAPSVEISAGAQGWVVAGVESTEASLTAALQGQDDFGPSRTRRSQRSGERGNPGALRNRRVFIAGDPGAANAQTDRQSVRNLDRVSPDASK